MTYHIDLFSPETYETFTASDRTVSGFRLRQAAAAWMSYRLICIRLPYKLIQELKAQGIDITNTSSSAKMN